MSTPEPLFPSYTGFVGSTEDAVLVIQAVLTRQFPVVQRRPLDRERPELIKLGNVFVFIEESSNIKRWTDGIAWLALRILGRFLVYRELDQTSLLEKDDKRKRRKQLADAGKPNDPYKPADPYKPNDPYHDEYRAHYADQNAGYYVPREAAARPVTDDRGLIKKTISITTTSAELHMKGKPEKQTVHVICYYSAHDVLLGNLLRPLQTNLRGLAVPEALREAARRSLLGGKIPTEDEAYYFLDSNYQLQNMNTLLKKPLQSPVAKPTLPAKYPVIRVPFAGPAPPVPFHADYVPQQLQSPVRSQTASKEKKAADDYHPPPLGHLVYNYPAQYLESPEMLHLDVQNQPYRDPQHTPQQLHRPQTLPQHEPWAGLHYSTLPYQVYLGELAPELFPLPYGLNNSSYSLVQPAYAKPFQYPLAPAEPKRDPELPDEQYPYHA